MITSGIYVMRGRRVIGISGSLIWSKTLMELIFNPCGELRWSPEGPVSQIHPPYLHVGAPGIFSDLLRSVQMLKRQWGVESNGELSYLFIPWGLPRWSSGYHTRLWFRGSRVRSRPGSRDFFQSTKILSMASFGRVVKLWVPCRRFTARKRTSSRN